MEILFLGSADSLKKEDTLINYGTFSKERTTPIVTKYVFYIALF